MADGPIMFLWKLWFLWGTQEIGSLWRMSARINYLTYPLAFTSDNNTSSSPLYNTQTEILPFTRVFGSKLLSKQSLRQLQVMHIYEIIYIWSRELFVLHIASMTRASHCRFWREHRYLSLTHSPPRFVLRYDCYDEKSRHWRGMC